MAEIGAQLREARMRAKLDINEVETRTKIRAKYVRAMENEEWDLLPGDVYVRSFLRTYGDYLGLDSRALIDEYRRRYEHPSEPEARPPLTPRGRDRDRPGGRNWRPRVPPWAVVVVVLAAVVVALVVIGNNSSQPGAPTSSRDHASTPRQRAGRQTTHRARTPTVSRPRNVTLRLQPTGQVYVCLVSGRGQRLIPGRIFGVGQTIPTETRDKLLLTLGNANVKMTVNGVDVPVTASASSIGYELVPGSHTLLPPAKQPRCA